LELSVVESGRSARGRVSRRTAVRRYAGGRRSRCGQAVAAVLAARAREPIFNPMKMKQHTPRPARAGPAPPVAATPGDPAKAVDAEAADRPVEIGGPAGPEPTRYGDWERNGRCTDF